MFEDTHMNRDCLNCSHSYVTDEDDELHCPFWETPIPEDWLCSEWN